MKHIHLAALLLLCAFGHAMVPPHPLYGDIPESWEPTRVPALRNFAAGGGINSTDSPALGRKQKQGALPSKILTLMVEFSDVQFKSQPQYPDTEWGHDLAFFERWMLHLSDFFLDASHGSYEMDYTVYPQVFQLPKTLAYYGA
ncbi:MAG: hypothetical protein PHT37_03155, partial [Candidatus Cloacimonetes bacterium]|nr:hypothetical protein [Candidatus Cloacimonadota bacterium]